LLVINISATLWHYRDSVTAVLYKFSIISYY